MKMKTFEIENLSPFVGVGKLIFTNFDGYNDA